MKRNSADGDAIVGRGDFSFESLRSRNHKVEPNTADISRSKQTDSLALNLSKLLPQTKIQPRNPDPNIVHPVQLGKLNRRTQRNHIKIAADEGYHKSLSLKPDGKRMSMVETQRRVETSPDAAPTTNLGRLETVPDRISSSMGNSDKNETPVCTARQIKQFPVSQRLLKKPKTARDVLWGQYQVKAPKFYPKSKLPMHM